MTPQYSWNGDNDDDSSNDLRKEKGSQRKGGKGAEEMAAVMMVVLTSAVRQKVTGRWEVSFSCSLKSAFQVLPGVPQKNNFWDNKEQLLFFLRYFFLFLFSLITTLSPNLYIFLHERYFVTFPSLCTFLTKQVFPQKRNRVSHQKVNTLAVFKAIIPGEYLCFSCCFTMSIC